jgi:small-conductance mechanosensitive channel
VRSYILVVGLLIVAAWVGLFALDQVVTLPGTLGMDVQVALHIAVIIASTAGIILIIRRLRSTLAKSFGSHASVLLTFFMVLISLVGAFFALLNAVHVPANTLLLGGGIVSIVIGLLVSTLFGNIISGALMLTTFPFRIGDFVLVNSIPGRIEEVTSLYTRISSNSGGDTVIPNSAIISGNILISRLPTDTTTISTRLNYAVGDRIYTSYIGGEGTVTEITPYSTRVLLDSGRDAMIPNNGIFTGMVQIARIREPDRSRLTFQFKTSWDAEKVIAAIRSAGEDRSLFRSPIEVEYSSIDGPSVELKVRAEVDPSRRDEAKSLLLRSAYLVPH